MRKLWILGSDAGGTIVANMLRKELVESEWEITIIDRKEQHHYQAGYLFIPFGVYAEHDVIKPKKEFIPKGVKFVLDNVIKINTDERRVETETGGQYDYDWLVIATGCDIAPGEIDGMMDGWGKDIFDFYTLEGSLELYKKLKYFNSGKVVLNIAEFPFKCPIAPLEFVFMADWFFTVNGVRDKVDIEFVTPLDNVFTKPVAAGILAQFAAKKNIKVTPYFDLAQVNANEKTIESGKGEKVGYDLLVAIPPNVGDKSLIDSGISEKIAPLSDSARSISELKEELTPRVNEAVKALIVELADIEADFQLEDLLFFIKKALRNVRNLTYSMDQLKNIIDFVLIAEPLLKSTVPQIIFYMDDLEKKGVFNLLKFSYGSH